MHPKSSTFYTISIATLKLLDSTFDAAMASGRALGCNAKKHDEEEARNVVGVVVLMARFTSSMSRLAQMSEYDKNECVRLIIATI